MSLNKRGLSEVVTIGLIILLAIAAVVIVWSFVRPAITGVGEKIKGQGDCFSIYVEPRSCINTTADLNGPFTVNVHRGAGAGTIGGVALLFEHPNGNVEVIDDISVACQPDTLETVSCSGDPNLPALGSGQRYTVKVGAIFSGNRCAANDDVVVDCPAV